MGEQVHGTSGRARTRARELARMVPGLASIVLGGRPLRAYQETTDRRATMPQGTPP